MNNYQLAPEYPATSIDAGRAEMVYAQATNYNVKIPSDLSKVTLSGDSAGINSFGADDEVVISFNELGTTNTLFELQITCGAQGRGVENCPAFKLDNIPVGTHSVGSRQYTVSIISGSADQIAGQTVDIVGFLRDTLGGSTGNDQPVWMNVQSDA